MKVIIVLEVIGLMLVYLFLSLLAAPLKLVVWMLRGVVRALDCMAARQL